MELNNFTLYILMSENSCWNMRYHKRDESMYSGCIKDAYMHPACGIILGFDSMRIGFQMQYTKLAKDCRNREGVNLICRKMLSDLRKRKENILNSLHHTRPLCGKAETIEKTIQAILAGNSTGSPVAFVTFAYEFQHYWELFTEIMKQHPSWKIANNFETIDPFSVDVIRYQFSEGLHERHSRRLAGRLKALLSSGIYGLWNRWDRIRFSSGGLRHDQKTLDTTNGSPGDPMSFENSATRWVFWAQAMAWLGG